MPVGGEVRETYAHRFGVSMAGLADRLYVYRESSEEELLGQSLFVIAA